MIKKKSKEEIIKYPFNSHYGLEGWFMLFAGVIYLIIYLLNTKDVWFLIFGLLIAISLIIGGILIIRTNIKKKK